MGTMKKTSPATAGFFLRRADGVFAYQLAVVVDDALMGVDEVVRGSDLLSSTPRQLWLYRELGLTPPKFYHLRCFWPPMAAASQSATATRVSRTCVRNTPPRRSSASWPLPAACKPPPPLQRPRPWPAPSIGPRSQKATSFCRKICFNKIKGFPLGGSCHRR